MKTRWRRILAAVMAARGRVAAGLAVSTYLKDGFTPAAIAAGGLRWMQGQILVSGIESGSGFPLRPEPTAWAIRRTTGL